MKARTCVAEGLRAAKVGRVSSNECRIRVVQADQVSARKADSSAAADRWSSHFHCGILLMRGFRMSRRTKFLGRAQSDPVVLAKYPLTAPVSAKVIKKEKEALGYNPMRIRLR